MDIIGATFPSQYGLARQLQLPLVFSGNIAGNTTRTIVAEFLTKGFTQIRFNSLSNNTISVQVYQGATTAKNVLTTTSITGSTGEGTGVAASVDIVSSNARIDIHNAGAAAVFSFEAILI